MEATYKTRTGHLMIKVEAPNQKQLFKALAETQDIFEADTQCGCCHSPKIRFSVRNTDKGDYYELRCEDCKAQLTYGQHRNEKTLFLKRDAGDPNRGWKVWRPAAGNGAAGQPADEDFR